MSPEWKYRVSFAGVPIIKAWLNDKHFRKLLKRSHIENADDVISSVEAGECCRIGTISINRVGKAAN